MQSHSPITDPTPLITSGPESEAWLRSLGVVDAARGQRNLAAIHRHGVPPDLMAELCRQLDAHLGSCSDPDMALNNFERFVAVSRSPLALAALLERDPDSLPILLRVFSTSQHLGDLLVRDPESYDLLRITEGWPVSRDVLTREICDEVASLRDDRAVLASLRRYKHRETLRVAYGDIVYAQRVEVVTQQISHVADAICEAALQFAWRRVEEQRGGPRLPGGARCRFVVLALGKLGGQELNYSSDIDLILLYEADGQTNHPRPVTNREFFERLTREFVRLLTEPTQLGAAYRVDLRLRPHGSQGSSVISVEQALQYYDLHGRTWERQAFLKARPSAGDLDLGQAFLKQLEPWIYRRYLTLADISGIRALKRRIEQRTQREGGEERNVKTGWGGLRDIEFVTQFLQLWHGAELPQVRAGNTLEGITRLEQAGCLTPQERLILSETYAFLRKIEHRLQIMFDLKTHTMPADDRELRKLALRLDYKDDAQRSALDAFKADHKNKTSVNRKILDHLLYQAFGDDPATEPEVDLVLDPDPPEALVRGVLVKYNFSDVASAHRNLMALAEEKIPFLSTRRCRHFLAAIAPKLLPAIAETPDPDYTLLNLSQVSDSLGGKGALWELFRFLPAALRLYVSMCAASPYLSGILTSNPGMIDELMDSLLLDKLPTRDTLDADLAELCRGAEDLDLILHSFKNSEHLRVGVRDILGKEDIRDTHRALANIAEVVLKQVSLREYQKLSDRHGEPFIQGGPQDGKRCELVILALGKLGGREPNYHSDLDVVFLYEADGATRPRRKGAAGTSNQHFFSQLGQRIIKVITHLGPHGRLFELDARLRPTGKSGALAVSFEEFRRYFRQGVGQLWERQALCKARGVFGASEACERAMRIVLEALTRPWRPGDADEIRQMRYRTQAGAGPLNLKRAPGGTVDIEFLVQMLQLRHAKRDPTVLEPGTLDALAALHAAGALDPDNHKFFSHSYRLLRSIEARLRLMNTTARHDLPTDAAELRKLAFLLRRSDPEKLRDEAIETMREIRARFEIVFSASVQSTDVA